MMYLDLKKCFYCGEKKSPLNKDHIIPKSKQGRILISSCLKCNTIKSNLSLFEFYLLGRISKKVFLRMVNFIKITKSQDQHQKLFSLKEFEKKIKNNSFTKLIYDNDNRVFDIYDDSNLYIPIFKEIAEEINNTDLHFKDIDDYFIRINYFEPNVLIRKLPLNKYRKLFKTVEKSKIMEELYSDMIGITSNYYKIIHLLNDNNVIKTIKKQFYSKFRSIYPLSYANQVINLLDNQFI